MFDLTGKTLSLFFFKSLHITFSLRGLFFLITIDHHLRENSSIEITSGSRETKLHVLKQ